MIRALVRNGFTVLVVSPEGEFVENLIELGCDHLPWKVGRRSISPVSEFLSIHQLKKIYKNVSPDLIHHHTLKSVIYGSIAARQAQIPFINSIPGRGFVYSSTSLQSRIIKPAVDLLLRQSVGSSPPHTIFENRGDMQYFLEKGFVIPNKAHLIRSVGVDTAAYTPKPPPIFDQFTVGYVGRMLWDKGAGIFAEAAKIIQTQN